MVYYTIRYIRFTASFQDNLGTPAPERQTVMSFITARDDDDGGGDSWNCETCKSFAPSSSQITTASRSTLEFLLTTGWMPVP